MAKNGINASTEIDGRLVRIHMVENHRAFFSISDVQQSETDEIDGYVKWDGCINWQTNPQCMAHFCRASDFEMLKKAFEWVHEQCGKLIPNADPAGF